jgi:hypothetical protein
MKLINIRGCNGSGKTTLLRLLVQELGAGSVDKLEVPDHKPIPVTYCPGGIAILGDYHPATQGTTAGCDKIKTQAAVKHALRKLVKDPGLNVVLFEGVVVATIYGPWKEFTEENGDNGMVWAFLDTPLDVCLTRIQTRNGGKPIKEDLVGDKRKTIARVMEKARDDNLPVAELRWTQSLADLTHLIEHVRTAQTDPDGGPGEEDGPWAKGWAGRAGGGYGKISP